MLELSQVLWLDQTLQFPLLPAKKYQKMLGVPLAAVGYTRFFEVGHSIDYGLAYAFPIDNLHALQVEVRDYRVFSNPDQHNVVLRVAWLLSIAD